MLAAGTKLGPYEILAPLGAGGMGEVYRAKDTRLDRTVAIKVLPSHLSGNPDFRQRFEREARTISSLSHPHICALYDIGHQEGVDFLVMEYLEGETLAQRLAKGAFPADQLLRYGIEIADALDKAHRQGITHRDLKPGNVMLTKSGAKLLDFGLAKFRGPDSQILLSGVSVLPTEARELTAEGTILGTVQYMSPEQLEGKETDVRTDIFALGTVLYEMATGKKAFTGKSQASLIAAILSSEPAPISAIQPLVPPALDRVVKTCLAKDPDDRWQTAHDVMLELKWIAEGGSQAGIPAPVVARRKIRERLAWILAAAFFVAALALSILQFRRAPEPARVMRLSVLPPEKTSILTSVISPDGLKLAFSASDASGKILLWVRSLDSLTAESLPETEGAQLPFWSPDSRYLGFFADGKLKKIEVSGGRPDVLCNAPVPSGGSWNSSGVIIFGGYPDGPKASLYRIASTGGTADPITKVGPREEAHRWPSFLADGRHFVFLGDAYRTEEHHLKLGSLDSLESTNLITSFISNVAYTPSEYVLFIRQGVLMAQHFDTKRLQLTGEPSPLVDQVALSQQGTHYFDFSVSDNGVLGYRKSNPNTEITWFDRSGQRLASVGEPGRYVHVELAPDGKRVAAELLDADGRNGDLWIFDASRGMTTRFTFDPEWDNRPVWSPDGTRIAFGSDRNVNGPYSDLYQKESSGGSDQLILKSDENKTPTSWSPDGKFIVFHAYHPKTQSDISLLQVSDHKVVPFLQTEFNESSGQVSPGGQWIAYVSDESGKSEVYIQTFPVPGRKWQISANGGIEPRWRGDGKELFYIGGDNKIWAAEIKTNGTLEAGVAKPLFEVRVKYFGDRYDYAVTADGQRFMVNSVLEESASIPVTLVFNWMTAIKK